MDGGAESDRATGLQLAGGLDIPPGPTVSIVPAVRYEEYTADFESGFGLFSAEAEVAYVTFDFGLHFHF